MIINPSGSMEEKKGSLPTGGTAGQMLTKKSAEDYDTQWQNAPGIPSGLIAMWSGAANKIPSGWVLCNGFNGTPDLRDRFIVGAGSSYSVGAKGGSDTVTLTVDQMPSHNHKSMVSYGKNTGNGTIFPYASVYEYTYAHPEVVQSTGGSQSHENRPPYYALCFIMKT